MVQRRAHRLARVADVGEVHDPPALRADRALDVHAGDERVAVQARALVALGHVREPVRGLEAELAEDLGGHGRGVIEEGSRDAEHLVGLQAESPPRMVEAVLHGQLGGDGAVGSVHRLQEEVREVEVLVALRRCVVLGEHELELVAARHDRLGVGLWRHAHPVDSGGHLDRPVRLDRDLEAVCVERVDECDVELQERFAAGAHDVGSALARPWPVRLDVGRQLVGRVEHAATLAVGPHEVGVAEPAHRSGAVAFVARPEVAPCEPAEDGDPAGPGALALERGEDLLHGVGAHGARVLRTPPERTGAERA